jgi:hypothetical protein
MYHRIYTTYLQKELDFLKLLVSRFHEQEKVNGLELDVALQKTQEVYEQLLRIKLIPASVDIPTPIEVPAPKKNIAGQETKLTNEEPKPEIQQPQNPINEALNKAKPVTLTAAEPPTKLNSKQDTAKSGILADKLGSTDFHPINETLAQQKTGNNLSSKLQTATLSSISSGIGLNDKFLFIRELFKSDNVLFNNTIKYLDTAESLEEALDFINRQYDWDEKNETTQKFIHLIHRRHGNK